MTPIDALFAQWQSLKANTRIRAAMWAEAGWPLAYAPIDNLPSMAEAAAAFRSTARSADTGDRERLRRLMRGALASEGIKDLKPRQIPDTRWARKLRGARPIAWLPGAAPKGQDG
jgi:hypothetical protein